MRYAILSDVHANLPALEAVLGDVDARTDVDAAYHLGDLVGYGPWPDETVGLLRARGVPGVAGNYDSTVATGAEHCGCRYEDERQAELSHVSFAWTRDRVRDDTRKYLAALPFRIDLRPRGGHAAGPTVSLIHGAPTLNTLYWTQDRPDAFCRKMAARAGLRSGDVLVFGHTHVPWHREVDGIRFVNAGSVGRPRDGDPRACWLLLEVAAAGDGAGPAVRAEFRRVPYDIGRAARALREAGLPDDFAADLAAGGAVGPDGGDASGAGASAPLSRP